MRWSLWALLGLTAGIVGLMWMAVSHLMDDTLFGEAFVGVFGLWMLRSYAWLLQRWQLPNWACVLFGPIGAIAMVYGASNLTGTWLGEPRWWTHKAGRFGEHYPAEGREAMSALISVVGFGIMFFASWPYRTLPHVRRYLGVCGLVIAIYGVSALTGEWLGRPAWWWETTYFPHHDLLAPSQDTQERGSHDAISVGVLAVGLALAAFALWPRRSTARTAAPDTSGA